MESHDVEEKSLTNCSNVVSELQLFCSGPVFTKTLILRIFLRIVVFLRKILRIRKFLFTKILILRITLILRIFLRMAFVLRIFLRIRNCYMHKTLIFDTKSASKYRKSLLGLYSQ